MISEVNVALGCSTETIPFSLLADSYRTSSKMFVVLLWAIAQSEILWKYTGFQANRQCGLIFLRSYLRVWLYWDFLKTSNNCVIMQIDKQRKGINIIKYFFMRESSKLKKVHIQSDNSVTQKAEKHQSITYFVPSITLCTKMFSCFLHCGKNQL